MRRIAKALITAVLAAVVIVMTIWIVMIHRYNPHNVVVMLDCVPNSESAISIAKVVYRAYSGEEFDVSCFYCEEDGEYWHVALKTSDEMKDSGSGVTISKKDGTVIRADISKKDIERFYDYHKE